MVELAKTLEIVIGARVFLAMKEATAKKILMSVLLIHVKMELCAKILLGNTIASVHRDSKA